MRIKNSIDMKHMAFGLLVLFAVLQIVTFGQTNKSRQSKSQKASVQITERGFQPAGITLRRNVPAQITFLRTTDATCATEVVFPDYGIRRELPLNRKVVISFTPKKAGEFTFSCGMNMMRGKLVVK
jgi:plastocyanin domain-containing protein